jgi:RNA polymerase sigma factor (sigma-70 family)
MAEKFETNNPCAGGPGVGIAVSDVDAWFVREVLPLEAALMQFLQHNWRNKSDIADLRQEIYVRVLEAAQRQIPDRAAQFIFRTARNLLTDRVRREHVVPIEAAVDLDAVEIALDEPGPDRTLIARDELRQLQAALDLLPPRSREAIVLGRIEGLSGREIAQRMGIGVATVSEHLANGLCALADNLSHEPQALRRKRN